MLDVSMICPLLKVPFSFIGFNRQPNSTTIWFSKIYMRIVNICAINQNSSNVSNFSMPFKSFNRIDLEKHWWEYAAMPDTQF